MPELPEVQTYVDDLARQLPGRCLLGARCSWPRQLPRSSPSELDLGLAGRRVRGIRRRGKYIVLDLEPSGHLIVHLKMSGRLQIVPAVEAPNPHAHVVFLLDRGDELRFHDPRKFGRVWLEEDTSSVLGRLGPEPLEPGYAPADLAAALKGRRQRLKPLLLDQRTLAGLGNIYVDEALFAAGLHPLRRADSLSAVELRALYEAIREVLTEGVRARGTSFSSGGYRDLSGNMGEMQGSLKVFRRSGLPCPRCGRTIRRLVIGGRSTHVCESCQEQPKEQQL